MGYKVKRIMVGDKQVRPVWKPNANTVGYYPLNGDTNDYSGNSRNLTVAFGTASYTAIGTSGKVAFNPQSTGKTTGGCGLQNSNSVWNFTGDFTVSYYVKIGSTYSDYISMVTNRLNDSSYRWMCSIDSSKQFFFHGSAQYLTNTVLSTGTWYNITCTVLNGVYTIYINSTSVKSGTYSYSASTPSILNIGFGYNSGDGYTERFNGLLSEVIIENKGWTVTDIQTYYNSTKSNYGL